MKIYQIHEYGGEWEDSFDIIVGTFFHKENAQKKMEKLKQELSDLREKVKRCEECWGLPDEERIEQSCYKEAENASTKWFECANEIEYDDTKGYELKEIEVEDSL